MAIVLTLNPGSNSLKADVMEVRAKQRFGCESTTRTSAMVENIGKQERASFSRMQRRETAESHEVEAKSFTDATGTLLNWLREQAGEHGASYEELDLAAVRVVHGGTGFDGPTLVDASVEREIEALQQFAPLHNARSLEVIRALRKHAPEMKIAAGFDTSFYRKMPEVAWRYPLPPELADKHGIRRYGFHGFSHRSLLERYALETKRPFEEIRLVSLHLESGCSATAIRDGVAVDNSMGLTPLEGLMMGTRSGSVDPAIVQVLMKQEALDVDGALEVLNKKSGLLGVSGISLDTRVLMKQLGTPRAALAMEMFCYRVAKQVGAYLAALGGAEAIVFGGGIGEDEPMVRARVCRTLRWAGAELDEEVNKRSIFQPGRLSTPNAGMAVWTLPAAEAAQIAFECAALL
ncbi:MAG TPA: acetate/propionate family kinase [Acidobacteriaceae bacterium]|nr:acetate/propionate family kinase [Acidobacteriaceae bacterium]